MPTAHPPHHPSHHVHHTSEPSHPSHPSHPPHPPHSPHPSFLPLYSAVTHFLGHIESLCDQVVQLFLVVFPVVEVHYLPLTVVSVELSA